MKNQADAIHIGLGSCDWSNNCESQPHNDFRHEYQLYTMKNNCSWGVKHLTGKNISQSNLMKCMPAKKSSASC